MSRLGNFFFVSGLTLLTVTITVATPSAVRAQTTTAAETTFAEGQALMNAKRLPEAADRFEAAVAADPRFAAAWYALAVTRRRMNQCTSAIAAYRRYAALEPDKSEPYYGLGLCLRETGDRAGAIEALKHYIAIERQPAAQRWIENARSILDDLGAGEASPATPSPAAHAEVAKPVAPKPAPTPTTPAAVAPATPAAPAPANAFSEAQALRTRGHVDEAIAKYQQAIAADPKRTATRIALGELLLDLHRNDEAIEVFRAALDKTPAAPQALYDLAFALRVRDRPAEAVDAYQRYIKLRPNDPDAYFGLGRALQRLGRKVEARKAYQTYVALEKRPAERRWVVAAQAQLKALAAMP